MMHALLLNDCSDYHCGSKAVRENIQRLALEAGITLTIGRDPIPCDALNYGALIINGEGTMHHNAQRAVALLEEAKRFKAAGVPVFLINTVHQRMDGDFAMFDLVTCRESLSAASARAAGANVVVTPDLAFCTPMPLIVPGERSGIMFVDSMAQSYTRMIEEVAAEYGAPVHKMCAMEWDAAKWLQEIARVELLVTGRFHAAVFAMMTGTPFFAMPSNTFKTRGMMTDAGIGDNYCTNAEELRAKLKGNRPAPAQSSLTSIVENWRSVFATIANSRRGDMPPPMIEPRASVVLVGNGPSVKFAHLGKVIDAFDVVVRFNTYTIEGVESHVGTKTDVWSTFGKGSEPRDRKSIAKTALVIHEGSTPALPMEKIWEIPASFHGEMCRKVRAISQHKNAAEIRPSSGFLVAMWLLRSGVEHLHLIGFDHFKKQRSKRHHYWHEKNYGRPHEHDGDAEAVLFAELVAEGRLHYLI